MFSRDARLYLCTVIMDMMTGLMIFTVTRRAADIGTKPALLGMLLSAFFLSYSLLAPVMGWLSDRLSRRGLMLAGCVVSCSAVVACIPVTDPWAVAGLMSLFGVGLALYWPPKIAWLSEGKTGRRLATSLALFSLAYNVGFLVGNAGGGALFFHSVPLELTSGKLSIPAHLKEKFSYHPEHHKLVLKGSVTDGERDTMCSLAPDPSARYAIDHLVQLSRHRPLPLLVAVCCPVVTILLLLVPTRAPSVFPLELLVPATDAPHVEPSGRKADGALSPNTGRNRARVFLWTAWIGSFGCTFSSSGVRAVFPGLADSLQIPPDVHGLLNASAQASAVATFLVMQVSFFWHRRLWPLLAAQAMCVGGLLLISITNMQGMLALGFLMVGISNGYCLYAGLFYSMELFTASHKGRGSGFNEAVMGSGLCLGPIVGGLLGQTLGSRSPYVLCAALVMTLLVVNGFIGKKWAQAAS